MKQKTLDKVRLLTKFIRNLPNPNSSNISNIFFLTELLSKYKIADDRVTANDYEIFRDKDIIETLEKFIVHNSLDLNPLKNITIIQYVFCDSCLKDFDAIYQNLFKNINNIAQFQNKFDTEVCINIHIKAFDSEKAIAISNLIVNSTIDYINFVFDFPPITKTLASSLISNLEQFSENPILKNAKIRLMNFPFCFIPASKYKCLYRHEVNNLKGVVFLQRNIISELKKRKFIYLKPCRMCRCKIPCYAYTDVWRFPEYSHFLSSKTHDTVAFVGGSLPEVEYYFDENIVYTTPAEQGDMFMVILEGFKNIILIDGYFYFKFPCTTFEVMLVLENGINAFGSSSIGALRAVELEKYGMKGVGYVYEYLKKHEIKPYHVVAQTYNEHDAPLTIPLINIIYFLDCALSKGVINKDEFDNCLSVAENIHFTLLSFEYFFKRLSSKGVSAEVIPRLESYFSYKGEEFFNIKRKDAILLLNKFRDILENRSKNFVKKTFNRAKKKYLKILYSKYSCNYKLTLPKDWRLSFSKDKDSIFRNSRDNREYSAEITCELAKKFFQDLDIVIADTSKFDSANSFVINNFFIPFYFLEYGLSSSTGNGDNFKEALASAYMELIERIPYSRFNINALEHRKIDRRSFLYNDLPQYYNWDISPKFKSKIFKYGGYVEATDILSAKTIFIPRVVAMSIGSGSDGNSSGNTLPEAILYGIYELIERDTLRIYEFNALQKLKSKLLIDKRDIKDKRCQTLLKQFETKGLKIVLLNLLNIYNIPCVTSIIYDLNHRIIRHGSCAARADFYSVIYAVLHEAYMLYITYFAGTRDDYRVALNKYAYIEYKQKESVFLKSKNFIKMIPQDVGFNSVTEELEYVINRLTNVDIRHIIAVNTSPNNEYSVKSVKMIIPKLELFYIEPFKPSPFYYKKVNRTVTLIRRFID